MKNTPEAPLKEPAIPSKRPPKSFDSMKAAVEFIGGDCSEAMLRAAKKAGCPGFHGGKVYWAEITEWLAHNPIDPNQAETKEKIQIRKLKAECERLERENKKAAGTLISLSDQIEICARLDAEIWKAIDEGFGDAVKMSLVGVGTYAEVDVKIEAVKSRIRHVIYAPTGTNTAE